MKRFRSHSGTVGPDISSTSLADAAEALRAADGTLHVVDVIASFGGAAEMVAELRGCGIKTLQAIKGLANKKKTQPPALISPQRNNSRKQQSQIFCATLFCFLFSTIATCYAGRAITTSIELTLTKLNSLEEEFKNLFVSKDGIQPIDVDHFVEPSLSVFRSAQPHCLTEACPTAFIITHGASNKHTVIVLLCKKTMELRQSRNLHANRIFHSHYTLSAKCLDDNLLITYNKHNDHIMILKQPEAQ